MGSQENVKHFTLTLAITLVLFLSGLAIPLAGILLLPLVPHPPLAFGVRYGKKNAFWLLLLASAILFLFKGHEVALSFLFFVLIVVLLISFFGRGWTIEAVVVSTAAGVLAAASMVLISLAGSLSRLNEVAREALNENLHISLGLYEKAGFPSETINAVREDASRVVDIVLQITPALVFISLVAMVLINLLLLSYRFPKNRAFFFSMSDPKEWRSPELLIWCFILSGFSLFFPPSLGLRALGLNLLLACSLFYFFQGLAIVTYFFHHKKVPIFIRSVGYVLIAFQQLFTLLVVGLGLFDLWGDFRRLNKRDLNPDEIA